MIGVDFVGQVIKPRVAPCAGTFNEARTVRRMDAGNLFESANSYFGLLRQVTHSHADRVRPARHARAGVRSTNDSPNPGRVPQYGATGFRPLALRARRVFCLRLASQAAEVARGPAKSPA